MYKRFRLLLKLTAAGILLLAPVYVHTVYQVREKVEPNHEWKPINATLNDFCLHHNVEGDSILYVSSTKLFQV